MAWLTGWSYRKAITVSNGSADYQTKVLVGKTSAAVGEDVDCGGNVADDFDDLRFTAADGTTLLDYWIEKIEDSGGTKLATVWVQNNATPDTTLYMYYGGTETPVSSGADTFIQYHGVATADFLDTPSALGTQIRYEAKVKRGTLANHHNQWGVADGSTGGQNTIAIVDYYPSDQRDGYTAKAGTQTWVVGNPCFAADTYYRLKSLYSTTVVHFYVDGVEIGTGSTTNLPTANMGLWMNKIADNAIVQDWSFVAKYAATEPSFAFGSEQYIGQPFRQFYPSILAH